MTERTHTGPGAQLSPLRLPDMAATVERGGCETLSAAVETAPLDLLRTTDRNRESDRQDEALEVKATCPNPVRIVAEAVNGGTGEMRSLASGEVFMDCKRWTCPVCGPMLRRRWTAHLVESMAELPGLHFVTLTLDPKCGVEPADSRGYLIAAWSKYRKRLNRRSSGPVAFACTVEPTRIGMAHLHGVISCPGVDASTLASEWFAVGGGVVVDVQRLDGDRGDVARRVGYTVKYALKDAAERHVKGRRYLLTSQGLGYFSEAAKAVRTSYVHDMLNQDDETPEGENAPDGKPARPLRPEDELRPGEVLVWTTEAGRGTSSDPDKPTPEQVERWKALRLDKRSTSFRMKGEDGIWYETTQHPDGTRTKRALPDYRSLYERRTDAERAGKGADGE